MNQIISSQKFNKKSLLKQQIQINPKKYKLNKNANLNKKSDSKEGHMKPLVKTKDEKKLLDNQTKAESTIDKKTVNLKESNTTDKLLESAAINDQNRELNNVNNPDNKLTDNKLIDNKKSTLS